ncbi:unnamed protein product [Polarella glacialis]|uniref:Uncharacterized protein n=1 Tax=Polarella glacialis TaxID=89957 RepID=A0A813L4M8_POLGL|nr:unnamed protein product [Polarella glacialis]
MQAEQRSNSKQQPQQQQKGRAQKLLEKIPARATLAIVAVEAHGTAKPATAQQQQQKMTMGKPFVEKSAVGPHCELIAFMTVGLTSTRHVLSSTSRMAST